MKHTAGWPVLLLALSALSGCGGGGNSANASAHNFSAGGANVVAVSVGGSFPSGTNGNNTFNIPYVTVTVCVPGTSTCAQIDHVLVDTGSSGLRIMAPVLNGLALPRMADPQNTANTIGECLPFADGYSWGPVSTADITIGGEHASAVPVQVIGDKTYLAPSMAPGCTSNGSALDSVSSFDANGILGVSVFEQDCGPACEPGVAMTAPNVYYSCGASSCQATTLAANDQVGNPVADFATDNNGVILQLPSIPSAGAPSASGYLVFGIGTESNNGLAGAKVLTSDQYGDIITMFNGQTLNSSFVDSGSNALFFPDSSIPACASPNQDFYCPQTLQNLSASNQGQNGTVRQTSFQVANLDRINTSYYAIKSLAGPAAPIPGNSAYFDWGLPFFYGRAVFVGIEGRTAGSATGPYYAY